MSQNSPHSKSPPGQTVSPINLSFVILGNHPLLWLYLNPIMIANEAYLDGLGATVTLNYIPVMTPGLYDTFPDTPDTFPGHIGPFPGLLLMEILIFNQVQETM